MFGLFFVARRRCCRRFSRRRLFSFKIVRLKSSLTLEATHKRLHGALDTFNSQMMKPPLPVSPVGSSTSTPSAEGALRSAGATPPRRRRSPVSRMFFIVMTEDTCARNGGTVGGSFTVMNVDWCHLNHAPGP